MGCDGPELGCRGKKGVPDTHRTLGTGMPDRTAPRESRALASKGSSAAHCPLQFSMQRVGCRQPPTNSQAPNTLEGCDTVRCDECPWLTLRVAGAPSSVPVLS
ncbi:Atpase Wrnip1 [Manis pentadactyla]|nr:Atpase Wrnip1 [Manis pentadactyla]